MYKLLKAGLYRLKKDITFWIFTLIIIGLSVFTLIRSSINGVELDSYFNEFIIYESIFISLFISLFIGKEHSEGIIRNKVIVGCKRVDIYLSNLIISIIVCLFFQLLYYVIIIVVGTQISGAIQMQFSNVVKIILDTVLVIISYCSIFNFITMISSETIVPTVVGIMLSLALFILALNLSSIAKSEKYITTSYWENEEGVTIEKELNPHYPGEDIVNLAKNIYYIMPQGQANELSTGNTKDLTIYPIYSVSFIVIVNTIGVYLFNRKELR